MILDIIRYIVFGAFIFSGAIAIGSWSVRTYRLHRFGQAANLIRRIGDPVLEPIQRQLVQRGGNPEHAEWWLLGGTVAGGILVISSVTWVASAVMVATTGWPGWVYLAGQIVAWSLLIRVVGSWVGVGRYSKFMRPFYFLTDWIVEPLRRVIPTIGNIDITPFVAYILLQVFLTPFIRVLQLLLELVF